LRFGPPSGQQLIELIDQTTVLSAGALADLYLDAARRAAQDMLFDRFNLPKHYPEFVASPRL
jgi:hypothetical protein